MALKLKSVVFSGDACVDNGAEFGSVQLPSKPSEVFITHCRSKQECGCVSGLLRIVGLC